MLISLLLMSFLLLIWFFATSLNQLPCPACMCLFILPIGIWGLKCNFDNFLRKCIKQAAKQCNLSESK